MKQISKTWRFQLGGSEHCVVLGSRCPTHLQPATPGRAQIWCSARARVWIRATSGAGVRHAGGGGGAVRAGRARAGGGGREEVMCSPAATDLLDIYQAACGKRSNIRHSGAGWARRSLALFAGRRLDVAGRDAHVLARGCLAVLVGRFAGRRVRLLAVFAAHGEAARRFSPGPAPPFEAGVSR